MDESAQDQKLHVAEVVLTKNPHADVSEILQGTLITTTGNQWTRQIKAYLISFFLAPFGLYYIIRFLFVDDQRTAGLICLLLTLLAVFLDYMIFSSLFQSTLSSIGGTQSIGSLGY